MKIKEIIFDSTLYSKWKNDIKVVVDGEFNDNTLDNLIYNFDERVDVYCKECETKRIFAPDRGQFVRYAENFHYGYTSTLNKPILHKTFRCSANSEHQILYGFYVNGDQIVKIAEYPSKYDSVIGNFNKYKKVLKIEKLTELAKASQLESYGYAIAAFLYYRRIFEDIILQAFDYSIIREKIERTEFKKKRMEDKIDYVKDNLPDYFNENSHIYGILSKGVHELEENECQKYLPLLKAIIIYALDEAADRRSKELRKKKLANQLKEINTILK